MRVLLLQRPLWSSDSILISLLRSHYDSSSQVRNFLEVLVLLSSLNNPHIRSLPQLCSSSLVLLLTTSSSSVKKNFLYLYLICMLQFIIIEENFYTAFLKFAYVCNQEFMVSLTAEIFTGRNRDSEWVLEFMISVAQHKNSMLVVYALFKLQIFFIKVNKYYKMGQTCIPKPRSQSGKQSIASSQKVLNFIMQTEHSLIENSNKTNARQVKYWKRRIAKIVQANQSQIFQVSINHMKQYFQYTDLNQIIIVELYCYMKGKEDTLTNIRFIESLIKIMNFSESQFGSYLYQLYFSNDNYPTEDKVSIFTKQFKIFFKTNQNESISYNMKYSMQINKTKSLEDIQLQLITMLTQPQKQDRKKEIVKWLKKNLCAQNFKLFFFQVSQRNEEMEAYRYLWTDLAINQSIAFSKEIQKQFAISYTHIISYRWCEDMLNYFESKYQVSGNQSKLKLKPILDQTHRFSMAITKKASLNSNNKINEEDKFLENNRFFSDFSPIKNQICVQISKHKIEEKNLGSGFLFQNHPGELKNQVLAGNFQWQLKRNIRKYHDFICINQETYDKLILAFGGGPIFKRRIIQGYLQIRPYYVICFSFSFVNQNQENYELKHQRNIQLSSSDLWQNLQKKIDSGFVLYHRNVGDSLDQYPFVDIQQKKVIDIFSETSFLICVPKEDKQKFKKCYLNKKEYPQIGDMYESSVFKIQQLQQNQSCKKLMVCVLEEPKIDSNKKKPKQELFVTFVVLNWSHYIKRKISFQEFRKKFSKIKNELGLTVMQKKNRGGISNLGNTCYLNATLQSLLSAFSSQQIKGLKGQLGIQFRQIYNYIKEKKKSIFPIDFKALFDKKVSIFQGHQQHDSHEFLLYFLDQLETENKSLIQKNFVIEYQTKNTCSKCKNKTISKDQTYVVSIPLKDYPKKQVKVDFVIKNTTVRTVCFLIDQDISVGEWRKNIQKYTEGKQIFLCEVSNSKILRSLNLQDIPDDKPYRQLQIQSHHLITAYQVKQFKSKLTLNQENKNMFKTFKVENGSTYVAKVNIQQYDQRLKQYRRRQARNQLQSVKMEQTQVKAYIKTTFSTFQQERLVGIQQLYRFPEDFASEKKCFQLINYDRVYNQKIGRPFLIKMNNSHPIKALRKALEEIISDFGYTLRFSKIDEPSQCFFCKKGSCKDCLLGFQSEYPLCWIQGKYDIVVVWDDAVIYHSHMKREKFNGINQKDQQQSNPQDYDTFSQGMTRIQQEQIIDAMCLNCNQNLPITKSLAVKKCPQILILHLIRFRVKDGKISKNHINWKLQQEIQIDEERYNLESIVCHIGSSSDYGHYIGISNGIRYDDELVTQVSLKDVKPGQVYILFYRKIKRK